MRLFGVKAPDWVQQKKTRGIIKGCGCCVPTSRDAGRGIERQRIYRKTRPLIIILKEGRCMRTRTESAVATSGGYGDLKKAGAL
jgi:hypothetical protein